MDWVKKFYSKTGQWSAPAIIKIKDEDRKRVNIIKRLAPRAKSILELGAGYGTTAAACAESGYIITAIDISDRLDFSKTFARQKYKGSLRIIKGDFYKVDLNKKFDVVTYWNGFGIGTDEDQRRLLRRISDEWLKPEGVTLIDIYNPFVWKDWAEGNSEEIVEKPEERYNYNVSEKIEFDPVNNRLIDTRWETDKPEEKVSQNLRCYTPADLLLLIENTGLTINRLEVDSKEIEINSKILDSTLLQRDVHEYLTKLTKK